MSDNDPNKKINLKRTQVELFGIQLSIQRLELRLMEIEEEKTKIEENIDASNKRIIELQRIITTGA
jgi:hypothetical protein